MIKKEEIKKGLKFVLPYDDFKDEEDEKEYIRRLVRYGFEGISFWKNVFYTKIQFDGEERTIETIERPVFEVFDDCEFKQGIFVKNKNAGLEDEAYMFIDLSFVEKFGEKVMKKQKKKEKKLLGYEDVYPDLFPRNEHLGHLVWECNHDNSWIERMLYKRIKPTLSKRMIAWEAVPMDKYGIYLDSAIENNKPCNVKKDAEGEMSLKVDLELSEETCKKLNKFYEDLARIAKELAETGSEKEDADRFKEITDKMLETYKSKNKDYGDSFRNLFKECGMTYAYGHLKEKLERVKSLMSDEAKVKGESMKDSLYDLANYAILTIMEIEKWRG